MSTVEMDVECGRCRNPEATGWQNTKSGAERVFCRRCGWIRDLEPISGRVTERGGYGHVRVEWNPFTGSADVSLRRRQQLGALLTRWQHVADRVEVSAVRVTVRIARRWRTIVLTSQTSELVRQPRTRRDWKQLAARWPAPASPRDTGAGSEPDCAFEEIGEADVSY